MMWYLCLMASSACEPAHAENEAITKGLGKYVKRKKLDRIDTYVPPLFRARDQLIRIGRVMCTMQYVYFCYLSSRMKQCSVLILCSAKPKRS